MKGRAVKWVALALGGGVLFQVSSCAAILVQLLVQNALRVLIEGILNNAEAAAG